MADQIEAGISIRWCYEPKNRGDIMEGSFIENNNELSLYVNITIWGSFNTQTIVEWEFNKYKKQVRGNVWNI